MASAAIFLRHGATEWSTHRRLTSWTDVDLARTGEIEARAAARAIRAAGLPITRILVSPTVRARRTAELVASHLGTITRIEVDDRLQEVGFGRFEGVVAGTRRPAGFDAALRASRKADIRHGVEPLFAAAERAAPVMERLRKARGVTLVVGHGYLTRLMIARDVIGLPLENFRRLRLDTGRFAVVRWDGASARLIGLNLTDLRGLEM